MFKTSVVTIVVAMASAGCNSLNTPTENFEKGTENIKAAVDEAKKIVETAKEIDALGFKTIYNDTKTLQENLKDVTDELEKLKSRFVKGMINLDASSLKLQIKTHGSDANSVKVWILNPDSTGTDNTVPVYENYGIFDETIELRQFFHAPGYHEIVVESSNFNPGARDTFGRNEASAQIFVGDVAGPSLRIKPTRALTESRTFKIWVAFADAA